MTSATARRTVWRWATTPRSAVRSHGRTPVTSSGGTGPGPPESVCSTRRIAPSSPGGAAGSFSVQTPPAAVVLAGAVPQRDPGADEPEVGASR